MSKNGSCKQLPTHWDELVQMKVGFVFAPDAQIIWAVTHGSLYPATSLKIANQLFETYTADNGLRVCSSQLTSNLGHTALSILGSSRLGLQA